MISGGEKTCFNVDLRLCFSSIKYEKYAASWYILRPIEIEATSICSKIQHKPIDDSFRSVKAQTNGMNMHHGKYSSAQIEHNSFVPRWILRKRIRKLNYLAIQFPPP